MTDKIFDTPEKLIVLEEIRRDQKRSAQPKRNGPSKISDELAAARESRSADDADDADARMTPTTNQELLVISRGQMPATALRLRDILAASGKYYERGSPVRVVKKGDDPTPFALPLTVHGIAMAASKLCATVTDEGSPANLPDRVAAMYLDMAGEWNLRPLSVISTAPILSPDGGIKNETGYDDATGIYCYGVPDLNIPRQPTKAQADKALLIIRKTFKTFAFADAETTFDDKHRVPIVDLKQPIGHDESGFLNALMTAVCRPSLPLAPGYVMSSPQLSGAGTGKGLLGRAICIIAYGLQPRAISPGNDSHEMDKRIVAEILEGRQMVFLDNVNGRTLRSDTIASLLTERQSALRLLGRSQMVQVMVASFFIITGNGLTISEDLARRFLNSTIDAHMESPESRPFGPGFLEEIAYRRAELLNAILTIWRWGRYDRQKQGKPLGSYEEWSRWVRDPLMALGCKDPAERIDEIKARDPNRRHVRELFDAWLSHHGSDPIKASALHDDVKAIADPKKRGRQYLARVIGGLEGTRQSGYHLRVDKGLVSNSRKAGVEYVLEYTAPQQPIGLDESSASSASPTNDEETSIKSGEFEIDAPADDPADDLRMTADGADDVKFSEFEDQDGLPNEFSDLDVSYADGADDADESGHPPEGDWEAVTSSENKP